MTVSDKDPLSNIQTQRTIIQVLTNCIKWNEKEKWNKLPNIYKCQVKYNINAKYNRQMPS